MAIWSWEGEERKCQSNSPGVWSHLCPKLKPPYVILLALLLTLGSRTQASFPMPSPSLTRWALAALPSFLPLVLSAGLSSPEDALCSWQPECHLPCARPVVWPACSHHSVPAGSVISSGKVALSFLPVVGPWPPSHSAQTSAWSAPCHDGLQQEWSEIQTLL